MSIEQRKHVRFSLDIPAVRYTKYGEKTEVVINQISIGGCLIEADEQTFVGEDIRLEVRLPNKNWLPLYCKILYKMEDNSVGAKFLNITRFEQELLAKIISHSLEASNLPVQISPFQNPSKTYQNQEPRITDLRAKREEILEQLFSSES